MRSGAPGLSAKHPASRIRSRLFTRPTTPRAREGAAVPAEDEDVTPADQETIDADDVAQEAADQLDKAAAIERNNRLWVTAITPILAIEPGNLPASEDVREAVDRAIVAAAERLVRLLKSDLSKG